MLLRLDAPIIAVKAPHVAACAISEQADRSR